MTDPFDALRTPVVPADPDPAFTARLRARLQRALEQPKGTAMPPLTLDAEASPATTTTDALTPYLAVTDARSALRWYVEALGARRRGEPIVMPDGRIGHAELDVAGARLMLSDEHPEIGVVAPRPGGGATVTLHITVTDVDAVTARAVEAGAVLDRPPADYPYGRNAVLVDPFGHRWMVASEPVEPGAWQPRHGDVAYVSLWVGDVERAATFFSAVLGWTYGPDSEVQGRQVSGVTPRHGLWGGHESPTLFLCFAVDNVVAAVERVRAAGGEAGETRSEPYGLVADCVDDQGVSFALVEVPPPGGGRRPAARGRHGDLAYVTMEVLDSRAARAFYGSVLGWRFTPGRVEDGWGPEDVVPMFGLVGGQERATIVPMYHVDDIAAAVERVRAAGGTATDPERQPYGRTSTCADDQGTRFYLGEL